MKDQYPEPIDERAVSCCLGAPAAHADRCRISFRANSVGREALESSSAAFQATAKPSQLPTRVAALPPPWLTSVHEKRPDVLATPSLRGCQTELRPSVTSAADRRGYSRRAVFLVETRFLAARSIPYRCVLGSNSAVRKSLKSRFLKNPQNRHEMPASVRIAGVRLFRRRSGAEVRADFFEPPRK